MKKNERKILIFSIILIISILFSLVNIIKQNKNFYVVSPDRQIKVMVIDIAGAISYATIQPILASIEEVAKDSSIKGVIFRINSPGGTVGASQEIYHAILRLREEGVKVIASMGDMAASGGYYIAAACETIVANPGTITGSIGVIVNNLNVEELFQKIGIKPMVFKSGAMKDILSPFRKMKPEEEKYIQAMIMNTYQQFFDAVLLGRKDKITEKKLKEIADGRIFTGLQAKEVGLIDVVGGLEVAKEEMKKLLGQENVVFVSPKEEILKEFLKELMKNQSIESLFLEQIKVPVLYYYGGF